MLAFMIIKIETIYSIIAPVFTPDCSNIQCLFLINFRFLKRAICICKSYHSVRFTSSNSSPFFWNINRTTR